MSIEWLAGLLEGEGCFGIYDGRPEVQLRMTDLDVIEKASAYFPGNKIRHETYPKNPTWKDSYRIRTRGKKAIDLMRLLLPYMGNRRSSKILEILREVGVDSPHPTL